MFKYAKNALPNIFYTFFTRNDTIHDYFTRHGLKYRIPLVNTNLFRNTIRLRGVHIFNYFSQKLSYNYVFVTYKYHLKKFIHLNDVTYETCTMYT